MIPVEEMLVVDEAQVWSIVDRISVVEMAEYEWDLTQNVKRWQMRLGWTFEPHLQCYLLSPVAVEIIPHLWVVFWSCSKSLTSILWFAKGKLFLVMFKEEKNKLCLNHLSRSSSPKIQSSWTPTQVQNGDMLICRISPAALSYSTSENDLPPLYVLCPWPGQRLSLVQMPILWI